MTPTCRIQTCASGFANCDTNHANGCEVRTTSDLRNCGGCGVACGASEVCESGGCVCGMSRGVTGGGPACVSPDRCCPGDRCRPMTSACAVK
jgi:hypothetical protein